GEQGFDQAKSRQRSYHLLVKRTARQILHFLLHKPVSTNPWINLAETQGPVPKHLIQDTLRTRGHCRKKVTMGNGRGWERNFSDRGPTDDRHGSDVLSFFSRTRRPTLDSRSGGLFLVGRIFNPSGTRTD